MPSTTYPVSYTHLLAYLYGGVPLLLTEVVGPKFDYVRASKEEVLEQAISDVEFAATYLPLSLIHI